MMMSCVLLFVLSVMEVDFKTEPLIPRGRPFHIYQIIGPACDFTAPARCLLLAKNCAMGRFGVIRHFCDLRLVAVFAFRSWNTDTPRSLLLLPLLLLLLLLWR
jgi:hypothetical protein